MLPSPSHLTFESLQTFLSFFILFWLLAVVFHYFCCRKFQWYQNQVQNGTIQVSFGRLYLTSHYLNTPIQNLGSWPRLVTWWRIWFICGVLVSSALIIPVVAFLMYLFVGHVQRIMRSLEVGPVQAVEYTAVSGNGSFADKIFRHCVTVFRHTVATANGIFIIRTNLPAFRTL